MHLLAILLFVLYYSVANTYSQKFCTNNTVNALVDSVFNFNDTIYAFRKPNDMWILKIDEISGNWSQIGDVLQMKKVFKNFQKNSFDSVFSVTDFVKCDFKTDPSCPYESKDFDATNVTFIFAKHDFIIYRRIAEDLFEPLDYMENNTIPWDADKAKSNDILNFFHINGDIDSAIYTLANFTDPKNPKRYAILYSNSTVRDVLVNDNTVSGKDTSIHKSPAASKPGNGGIVSSDGKMIFIVDNKLYRYESNNIDLIDLAMTTWDYFNCDYMEVIVTTTTPLPTTNETSSAANETSSDATVEEETGMTWSETTVTPILPPAQTQGTGTANPTASATPQSQLSETAFRKKILTVTRILFLLVFMATVLVTVLSCLSFKILS